jgi:hypothetical protein
MATELQLSDHQRTALDKELASLKAMLKRSRAVSGAPSFEGRQRAISMIGGEPSSRRYKRIEIEIGDVPYLIEAAFSFRPHDGHRTIVTGLNWSISITGNPFQCLGDYDEGLESVLADRRAGPDEPSPCARCETSTPTSISLSELAARRG